jgi:hypothetical protein
MPLLSGVCVCVRETEKQFFFLLLVCALKKSMVCAQHKNVGLFPHHFIKQEKAEAKMSM